MLEKSKILVAGSLGKSGKAAVELYLELGAHVIVSDAKQGDLPDSFIFSENKITDVRPRDDASLIEEYSPDIVVTAPGVPLTMPLFVKAREKGIPVYGECDFAYKLMCDLDNKKPFVVGVTGTDGKSTTTALVTHLLNVAAGLNAVSCGNFGLPLSDLAKKTARRYDVYVIELSSYQLEPQKFLHPEVSMILNIAEDHLDRYEDMDDYLEAKLKIMNSQEPADLFLAPAGVIEKARKYAEKNNISVRMITPEYSERAIRYANFPDISSDKFSLKGFHNLLNLSFALKTLEEVAERKSLNITHEMLLRALGSFRGLSHRFENLGVKNGITFINDSKSTTCQSMVTAIHSLRGENIFLLCGGRNKGIDFSVLADYSGVHFFPYGETGPEIAGIVGSKFYPDLKAAFREAVAAASGKKSVVLLSPGCASFDLYGSYAERGEHFKSLVESL